MMEHQELLKEKVESGFVTCRNDSCRQREHCLRWLGQVYEDPQPLVCKYVNMSNPAVGGEQCPMYRQDQKVRLAIGFVHLLCQLPRNKSNALMAWIKSECHRTYAYEYRNGTRPIPPSLQQLIIEKCRQLGWEEPVEFDGYIDEYEW